jgi:histidinol dehydrogenase
MKSYKNPSRKNWDKLIQRPYINSVKLDKKVAHILKAVKTRGDKAILTFNKKFDGAAFNKIAVTKDEILFSAPQLDDKLKQAIDSAYRNIYAFHAAQQQEELIMETMPGVICSRKSVPVESVGLYIPGGTAPLFSTLLMLGIPAKIAGCKKIVVCTPANKFGVVHPVILYVAGLLGIENVYKIGGAQAIAAMAYGTATVPRCYKIFGPGNQFVTAAKTLVNKEGVAIDMPAGPSEVLVLADSSANEKFVAADLLSQAEHGIDSQVVLVSVAAKLPGKVKKELKAQVKALPRKQIAEKSLKKSLSIFFDDINEAIDFINDYAAEHLILAVRNPREIAPHIKNAGSVFLGHYSPESVGDYASGTNHTLPTGGFAKSYSGVSLDSFVKKITYQEITKEGLKNIGATVETMAAAEGLDAHKNAVAIRLKNN